MHKLLAVVFLATGLASCAIIPTPLQGQFAATTPRDAVASASGQSVRWGGEIIKVEPKPDKTCFEVLARSLNANARPSLSDPTDGRFIACQAGFYDPEVFERGRDITVVGQVNGVERGKVGQFDYTYPLIDASAIYLWPVRPIYVNAPYYDPWLYGFGPAWGWGGYGRFWGGSTVIIRDVPRPRPEPRPNR